MPKFPRRDPRETDDTPPAVALSEAALLERIRAGDERVFGQVFKTYYRGLCEVVYGYVRSRETAEELVQAVFLRVWERRERWEPAAGIRAYLFGAARNAALDHLRHRRVVDRAIEATGEFLNPSAGSLPQQPDEASQAADLADAVRRAIQELPERRRAAVILRWQHDLTNTEVARALGISVKGVEAHISRALVLLRERLAAYRP